MNKAGNFDIEQLCCYSGGSNVITLLIESQKPLSGYKNRKMWPWESGHGHNNVKCVVGKKKRAVCEECRQPVITEKNMEMKHWHGVKRKREIRRDTLISLQRVLYRTPNFQNYTTGKLYLFRWTNFWKFDAATSESWDKPLKQFISYVFRINEIYRLSTCCMTEIIKDTMRD